MAEPNAPTSEPAIAARAVIATEFVVATKLSAPELRSRESSLWPQRRALPAYAAVNLQLSVALSAVRQSRPKSAYGFHWTGLQGVSRQWARAHVSVISNQIVPLVILAERRRLRFVSFEAKRHT